MSQQEVLRIGGTPSGTKAPDETGELQQLHPQQGRPAAAVLRRFDGSGKVDGSGFLSCSELDRHERDARP